MKPNLKPINEQVVVLLGATSGIGLETAKDMAEKGATVVIIGRSQEGLNDAMEQVRSHIQAANVAQSQGVNGRGYAAMGEGGRFASSEAHTGEMQGQVTGLEADVTNFEQVKSAADQVVQRFGGIDTWVNAAAVSEWALFEDTTPDEFHRIIEVNLLGQTYGAMAALPYLKQRGGGALIFVASIESRIPVPYHAAYNASKHGILGLAETLRLELKHTNVPVSVTAILPASINTPLFDKARTKMGVEPSPIPPIYDVKMVAQAITYAAEHPVRELIVGDSGYMMTFMRRLAPTLTSNFMGATGFRVQRSSNPKSADAPTNLYHHISGYDKVKGDYSQETMHFSLFTWFATHPIARMALYGGLLVGLGTVIGWRVVTVRNQRNNNWRYRLPREAKKLSHDAKKLSRQATKMSRKASKAAGKAIKDASATVVAMPVVSNLPMFRKRTTLQRVGDTVTGWWAAFIALLPFINQRKSLIGRISDRIPSVNIPWNQRASMMDRLTMTEQRKAAMNRFAKATDKLTNRVGKQADKVSKQADKISNRVERSSKAVAKGAAKEVSRRTSSKSDRKAVNQKDMVIVRKQSFVEKMPFGERRETIIEREPVNKV